MEIVDYEPTMQTSAAQSPDHRSPAAIVQCFLRQLSQEQLVVCHNPHVPPSGQLRRHLLAPAAEHSLRAAKQSSSLAKKPPLLAQRPPPAVASATSHRAQENTAPLQIAAMGLFIDSITAIDDGVPSERVAAAGDKENRCGTTQMTTPGGGIENTQPQIEDDQMRRLTEGDYGEAMTVAHELSQYSAGASRRPESWCKGSSINKELVGEYVNGPPIDSSLVLEAISAEEAEQVLESLPQEPHWGGAAEAEEACWEAVAEAMGPAWGLRKPIFKQRSAEPFELIALDDTVSEELVLQAEVGTPLVQDVDERTVEEQHLVTLGLKSLDIEVDSDCCPRDNDVAGQVDYIQSSAKRPSAARPNSLAALIATDHVSNYLTNAAMQFKHMAQV